MKSVFSISMFLWLLVDVTPTFAHNQQNDVASGEPALERTVLNAHIPSREENFANVQSCILKHFQNPQACRQASKVSEDQFFREAAKAHKIKTAVLIYCVDMNNQPLGWFDMAACRMIGGSLYDPDKKS